MMAAEDLRRRAGTGAIPQTPRLTLREMSASDLDDMAALLGDPEVMRYYPRPKTREEALGWIRWNERLYQTFGFGLWLMRLAGTDRFVGDCGLTVQHVEGEAEVEVGYRVRSDLWCRGLATEAASACRDYATAVLGLDRLVAIVDPRNRPSQRVAEKIGMTVEREIVYAERPALLFVFGRAASPST